MTIDSDLIFQKHVNLTLKKAVFSENGYNEDPEN